MRRTTAACETPERPSRPRARHRRGLEDRGVVPFVTDGEAYVCRVDGDRRCFGLFVYGGRRRWRGRCSLDHRPEPGSRTVRGDASGHPDFMSRCGRRAQSRELSVWLALLLVGLGVCRHRCVSLHAQLRSSVRDVRGVCERALGVCERRRHTGLMAFACDVVTASTGTYAELK